MSIQQLDARLVLHHALAEGALRRGDRVSVTVHERAAASLSKIRADIADAAEGAASR